MALAVFSYHPTTAQAVLNEIYTDPGSGNHDPEDRMARLALILLLCFFALALIGWTSNAFAFFEVLRVLSVFCLTASLALFIVAYLMAPDVPDGNRP